VRAVKVGSRQSPLALAQTEEIVAKLRSHFSGRQFEVVPMSTGGDRNKNAPLLSLGRGTFVMEIEAALLRGDIDVAVHSAKDLPASLADGLVIAAFGPRQDARDVLVDRWNSPLDGLPAGARIGTGSPRRISQLKAARPDIELLPIRGNVGTRLEKAAGNDYDGVVLAAAGLLRLGREDAVSEYLAQEVCTPDAGQGALAVEAREDSPETLDLLSSIDHPPTSIAVRAERAFVAAIGGGCTAPIGAYGQVVAGRLDVMAMAAEPDGSRVIRVRESCDSGDPEAAGRLVADSLISAGAGELASWDGRR
jgi:hydroxymethylbilane synthase